MMLPLPIGGMVGACLLGAKSTNYWIAARGSLPAKTGKVVIWLQAKGRATVYFCPLHSAAMSAIIGRLLLIRYDHLTLLFLALSQVDQ